MFVGTVKLWDDARGFGFIKPDDSTDRDVFVHVKNLDGASELAPGARVEYDTTFDHTRGKFHAVDVRVI